MQQAIRTLRVQLNTLQRLERLCHTVIHELSSVSKGDLDRVFSPIKTVKGHLSTILCQVRLLYPTNPSAVQENVFDVIKREV